MWIPVYGAFCTFDSLTAWPLAQCCSQNDDMRASYLTAGCSAVPTWEHHIWQLKNQQRTASKTSAVHRWEHPIWLQLHNWQMTTVLFTDESIRFGSWICCSSIRILSSLYKLKFWLRTGGYREHYYLDMLIFQPLQGIFSILCCIIVLLENPTHYMCIEFSGVRDLLLIKYLLLRDASVFLIILENIWESFIIW